MVGTTHFPPRTGARDRQAQGRNKRLRQENPKPRGQPITFERQVRWQQRLAELEAVIAKLKAENEKASQAAANRATHWLVQENANRDGNSQRLDHACTASRTCPRARCA